MSCMSAWAGIVDFWLDKRRAKTRSSVPTNACLLWAQRAFDTPFRLSLCRDRRDPALILQNIRHGRFM